MLFSSVTFLYYFLPVTVALYFTAPRKLKNSVLLLASLFFYFYGEPVYSLLMLVSCLSGYVHGLLIFNAKDKRQKKLALVSSVVIGIGLLVFLNTRILFL